MKRLKPLVVNLRKDKDRFGRLLDSADTSGLRSGYVSLKPGEDIGEHSTKDREEVIIIFAGSAEIFAGKQPPFTVGKDSLVYIPPETTHNVINKGKGLLRYVYIVAPVVRKAFLK